MYRRIALVAAALSLVAGGLLVSALLRPYQDVQRFYGAALGIAGLLVGGVLLAGAVSIPAAEGQATWRGLRPRWPVIVGVGVIALITAGVGMAAAVAITSPDPQLGPRRVSDPTAPDTVPRRPPP
jgi:drug/metabolite transporter (DMT)-like permease